MRMKNGILSIQLRAFIIKLIMCVIASEYLISPAYSADKKIKKTMHKEERGLKVVRNGAGRRIALVIGNSDYKYAGSLANPANDARLIAGTLKKVGFELYDDKALINLDRDRMISTIEEFGDQIGPGDVALFYYAGHGIQVKGENYLLPVNTNIKNESEVRAKSVEAELLFAKLATAKNVVNIVILDSCRNNPFGRTIRSASSGLAQVTAPSGTIVAFSTAPGQVAEDGSGRNSIYTAALAKYVLEPGLRVEDVFKKVRAEVSGSTNRNQIPWENTSLTGDFAFIEGDALALKKAALAASGDAKKGELDALLKMEAEAVKQKNMEQAELRKKEVELAKLDVQIAEMKSRLGTNAATAGDSLQAMLTMVQQKEDQAQKLENLRRQREAEEQKRQQEIERLKVEAEQRRRVAVYADIAAYEKIINSPYGKGMADAAWQSLVGKYASGNQLPKGNLPAFLRMAIDGFNYGDNYTDPVTGMDFIFVKGGCFLMGCGNWATNCQDNEKPAHEACIDDFYIGKYEVTMDQWENVGSTSYKYFENKQNRPAEGVSWFKAQYFIDALNKMSSSNNSRTSPIFRLPTEAEWEYACRSSGKNEKYCGGDNVDEVAWTFKYHENGGDDGKIHPVGQKKPNGLGVYDMSGNMYEWVQDWYDSKYYAISPRNNPLGPTSGKDHVVRGASWITSEGDRSTYRTYYGDDSVLTKHGLRLAISATW